MYGVEGRKLNWLKSLVCEARERGGVCEIRRGWVTGSMTFFPSVRRMLDESS